MSTSSSKTNTNTSESTCLERTPSEIKPGLVCARNGAVVRGTLQALIEHLVPNKDYAPSSEYVFAFLLNVRVFASLEGILHELVKCFIYEQNAKTENFRTENRRKCACNVLKLLLQWCDEFPGDFANDLMTNRLNELLSLCCSADVTLQACRMSLLQKLKDRLKALDEAEAALKRQHLNLDAAIAKLQTNHVAEQYDLLDNDILAIQLAEHLSMIELEKLCTLRHEEFVYIFSITKFAKAGSSKPNVENNDRTKMATNVQNYVLWCNRLNDFVATEICKRKHLRTRRHMVEYFIDVAKECLNMGNFNSCVAIISALNMPAIKRLRKTWSKVDSSKLHAVEQSMDPEKNFSSYRSTLEAAVWRCNGVQYQVVIPAFCVFCRDLFAVYKYCKQMLPDDQLNFQAFIEFSLIVKSFLQWRNQKCLFEIDEELHRYIQTCNILTNKNLDLASFECEPPATNLEKAAYKKLKVDFPQSAEASAVETCP